MNHVRPLREQHISALFEEYRALYGLAVFRMNALDRRVSVAGGTLAAFVAGLSSLPASAQLVVLLGLPVALIGFMRATVNHARSFEDVLRRLEEIEREVNRLLEKNVLLFQSRHPSGRREVGGRTGRETTQAVLATVLLLLAACAYQFIATANVSERGSDAYLAYLAVVGVLATCERIRLGRYAYSPRADLAQSAD